MKLEIELDLNKIDYDSINKQIAEKIAELNVKEEYDIESKINNKITNMINEQVEYSYNSYIDNYWKSPTAEGKKLIESMSKTEIESRTQRVIEEFFINEYSEDTMREVMLKIIPDIFASILFKRMESALFNSEYKYYDQIHNMVRGEIDCAIRDAANRMGY